MSMPKSGVLRTSFGTGSSPGLQSHRLSGKKSPELRDFLVTFRIFELRFGGFFVGLQTANHHVNGTDLDPGFTVAVMYS